MSSPPTSSSPTTPVQIEHVTLKKVPTLTAESSICDPSDSTIHVRLSCEPEMQSDDEVRTIPKIKLYIKEGHDNRTVDGSLFCHIIHLYLRAKKTEKNYDLEIVLFNPSKIPPEVKKDYSGRLPAIRIERGKDNAAVWVDDPEDIPIVVEREFDEPKMYDEEKTDVLIDRFSGIMRKFLVFLEHTERKPDLVAELRGLENYLEKERPPGVKFLRSDQLMLEDCFLIPKLIQVTLGGPLLKSFDIPEDFPRIKRYLVDAAQLPAFTATRPSSTEIVLRWYTKTNADLEKLKENKTFNQLSETIPIIGTLGLRQRPGRPRLQMEDRNQREVHTFSAPPPAPPQTYTINYSFNGFGTNNTTTLPAQ